jgi:hypothetical protein
MSKIIFINQNQTEAEKTSLESEWSAMVTDGAVTVNSVEEPDMTWTTTINSVEAVGGTNKITIESEYGAEWVSKIDIFGDTESKLNIDPEDYTTVRYIP